MVITREASVREFELWTIAYMNSRTDLHDYYQNGLEWYRNAHNIAVDISNRSDYSVRQTSAILAITSANNGWSDNVGCAYGFALYGKNVHTKPQMKKLYAVRYENSLIGLHNIVFGERGFKTASFYHNIYNPESTDRIVTVDRWIAKLYGLDPKHLLGKYGHNHIVYQRISNAISNIALEMNLRPLELQAWLWCSIRQSHE